MVNIFRLINIALVSLAALFFAENIFAKSFDDLAKEIDHHSQIQSVKNEQQSVFEEGRAKGKWAEPQLRLDATNFPSENIRMRQSPMTSMGVTLSQNIPLTNKYSNIDKSYSFLTKNKGYKAKVLRRSIILGLWNHAIDKDKITRSTEVLKKNLSWIESMIKVSSKLYSTGKVSQRAILDLKIRKSQIHSDIVTREISLHKLNKTLGKLLDIPNQQVILDLKSVKWPKLESYLADHVGSDPQEMLLQSRANALRHKRKADDQNRMPEINVGLNYKRRNNIDGHGDFVGAFVSIPISTGARTYNYKSSSYSYAKAKNDLRSYQNQLTSLKQELKLEIKKLESELNILNSQTIKFAETSREITSKSYSVGRADYLELLRSELQLQNLLLKKIDLESQIRGNKALFLFETGMDLN
jgi:cobalt-zinc-cadmium efflux system outer membrane protein